MSSRRTGRTGQDGFDCVVVVVVAAEEEEEPNQRV